MLLSKHPLVYFMTSSWISCLIYFINLLCVHVSLWITLSTLETYIHESVNPSPWYPCSLPTIFLSLTLVVLVKKIYECLVYLFFFMHSYLAIVGLKLFLISIFSLSWLCSKWYRGSEDSMFVHIVFKCKHYKLCTNLGELPYFI
jgi:hypothetical protein